MKYTDFKNQTIDEFKKIPDTTFDIDPNYSSKDNDFFGNLVFEGKNHLVKIQNESGKIEEGEEQFILSFNYLVRIRQIPLDISNDLIYEALNKFNETYAIIKAIYYKKDDKGHTFWFRNEQLLSTPIDHLTIKNILISLRSSPKTLMTLFKG